MDPNQENHILWTIAIQSHSRQQNRGTRSYGIILCLVNSLLKHRRTSNADLIFPYLPNKAKLHYKNGSAQKNPDLAIQRER